ncbi:unnamed protein product [Adineta ricciae]|uniref:NADH:ubiquinone reductase (non-electrogenic) n=1 Tax=Adineta ricciae TaxID=249248 RepID=A0A814QUR7_ADIRI|nr:unnamed protein product [Adineta ricciae]
MQSGRLKRNVRNIIIVGIIGVGTYHGYRKYHRYQWRNAVNDLNENLGRKPRLIVLGTGWGSVSLLKHIDTSKYEVICVSPRNYFLMTPLLPSVSVGTIETRTVIESIRSLIGPHIQFLEANCFNVDINSKTISCKTNNESNQSTFNLNYDILIVGIGSENNTFNTPGVEQYAHFLKEIPDARRIRAKISDAFEFAMIPTQTIEEKKRLLQFIIVGGGPTGVEFAAELSDLIHEDLKNYYPQLVTNDVKITLIQSTDHILSTMDKKISEYTEKHFHRENIEILTNTRVKEVREREVLLQSKDSNEQRQIPCSVIVWATGIQSRPLTNEIRQTIGLNIQNNRMGLLTDQYLRVKGVSDQSIFALGDCATIEQLKLLDQIQSLFEQADTDHQNGLDLQEFRSLVQKNIAQYPQLEIFATSIEKAFAEADKENSGYLTVDTLRFILEKADKKIRTLPATAQVAYQQGCYLANLLNHINDFKSIHFQEGNFEPFRYKHRGSLAYVGGDSAVLDFNHSKTIFERFSLKSLSGRSALYLWKSFYLTEMFTGRTKVLLASDWIRTQIYGRDISRY